MHLSMSTQTPEKKTWLTFVESLAHCTPVTSPVTHMLHKAFTFFALLGQLNTEDICRRKMGCLAIYSEGTFMLFCALSLSSVSNFKLLFAFSEQHFNLVATLSLFHVLQPCFFCAELVFMGSFFSISADEIEHMVFYIQQLEEESWSQPPENSLSAQLKGFKCFSPLNVSCCWQ